MKTPALALLASLLGMAALSAASLDVPDQGLHFNAPDTWSATKAPAGAAFAAMNAAKTSEMTLIAQPNPGALGLDEPEFVGRIKDNFTNQLAQRSLSPTFTKDGVTTINGVPFYQLEGNAQLPSGHTSYFQIYVAATADNVYTLSFQSVDENSGPELEGIANSLTFATPPKMPDPSRPKTHMERVIHKLMPFAIGGGILLVVIVVGAFFVIQRRYAED